MLWLAYAKEFYIYLLNDVYSEHLTINLFRSDCLGFPYHSNPQSKEIAKISVKLPSLHKNAQKECLLSLPGAKGTTLKQVSSEKMHAHWKRCTEIVFVNWIAPWYLFLLKNHLCRILWLSYLNQNKVTYFYLCLGENLAFLKLLYLISLVDILFTFKKVNGYF